MDGAWALYEAWVALQHGDIDVALVYAFGRSTQGNLARGARRAAGPVQRRAPRRRRARPRRAAGAAMIDAGLCTESDMAAIVARGRAVVDVDRCSQRRTSRRRSARTTAGRPPTPWRPSSSSRATERAPACERPAWIRGIDHRIEPHALGARDLTRSPSIEIAAAKAGARGSPVDVAEIRRALHAPGDPRPRSRSASATRSGSILPAARSSRGRSSCPACSAIGEAAGACIGGALPRASPTRRRGRACSRTSSASWRPGDGSALRRHRHRSDQARRQARRRVDRRSRARGRDARARRRGAVAGGTSTRSSSARRPTCSRAS